MAGHFPMLITISFWNSICGAGRCAGCFREGRRLNNAHRVWDRLIEIVTQRYVAEELEFGNDLTMDDYERAVRVMAGENRFIGAFSPRL